MASFTDQISTFNPYVQQLPVEEMMKVGMYKQQKFDEGVQKIQNSIDRTAALPVSRDVDKAHLQSTLSEIGGKLKMFAAGDFSNAQLVNSVGGMINQVTKDPIIEAAVYSTANDRKQTSIMEADEKEGKLTPQARYNYERKRNAYLSDTKLTDEKGNPIKFSGSYTRSWDIEKNMYDAINAVGDSKFTAQQIFKTDPETGKIMFDAKGPILSTYAVEEIKQGKFSENIIAAIDSVLSRPEAQQELAMRGIYNYQGYDKVEDFVKDYEKEKQVGVDILEGKKRDLLTKGTLEKDPEKKKEIERLIAKTNDDITTLKNYEDSKVKQVMESKSLDGYKALLYAQNFKNQFQKAYITETHSRTYEESAPWKAQQQLIKDERDWWKAKQDVAIAKQNASTNAARLQLERDKWKNDPDNPNNPINLVPHEGGAVPKGERYSKWIEEGAQASDQLDQTKRNFALDYGMAVRNANGQSISREALIKEYTASAAKDPSFYSRQFYLAKDAVEKNPKNSAFSNLVSALPGVTQLEKTVNRYANQIDAINNDPKVVEAMGGKLGDVEKSLKPTTFNLPGTFFKSGKAVTLSPKDQIDYAIVQSAGPSGLNDFQRRSFDRLKQKFGEDYGSIGSVIKKGGYLSNDKLPWYQKRIFGDGDFTAEQWEAKGNILKLMNMFDSEAIDAKEEVLKNKQKGDSPLQYDLYPVDAKDNVRASIDQRLKTVIADKVGANSDLSKFSKFYSGSQSDRDKYKVLYNVDRESGTIRMELYEPGGLLESFEINKGEMDYVSGKSVSIPNKTSNVVKAIGWSPDGTSTNRRTSDVNDPNAYKDAEYSSSDFYHLKRPDVMGADIKLNYQGVPNVYFYIKGKDGVVRGVPFKASADDILPAGFSSIDAGGAFIEGLKTPAQIDNILKNANIK